MTSQTALESYNTIPFSFVNIYIFTYLCVKMLSKPSSIAYASLILASFIPSTISQPALDDDSVLERQYYPMP
jgi:hypothetical protein